MRCNQDCLRSSVDWAIATWWGKLNPTEVMIDMEIKLTITLSIGTLNWVTFHSINRSELMLTNL
ncbi:MAG: hypothetical protein ACTS40_00340 [Candidatus Hodgkinia cicadicola]